MSTIGMTCIMFAAGALSWWFPALISHRMAFKAGLNDTNLLPTKQKDAIGLYFGVVTCVAGLVGVSLGSIISSMWKSGSGCFSTIMIPGTDAVVSGLGAGVGGFFMIAVMCLIQNYMTVTWVLILLAIIAICINWAISMDFLFDIVEQHHRSTASALQTFVGHAFGDAISPYLIGIISDVLLKSHDIYSSQLHFQSLLASFSVTVIAMFGGAVALLMAGVKSNMVRIDKPIECKELTEDNDGSRIVAKAEEVNETTDVITTPSTDSKNVTV